MSFEPLAIFARSHLHLNVDTGEITAVIEVSCQAIFSVMFLETPCGIRYSCGIIIIARYNNGRMSATLVPFGFPPARLVVQRLDEFGNLSGDHAMLYRLHPGHYIPTE
jgi:hypothetical protein